MTADDTFRSWCDAREPALHRLAVLLTADEPAARDLLRQVLPRMAASWPRIGAVSADTTARADVVAAWRHGSGAHTTAPAAGPRAGALHDPDARDDLDDSDDLSRAAWRWVAGLPALARGAVVLTRHEGLHDAEAGRLLGVAPTAVRAFVVESTAAVSALVDQARQRDPSRPPVAPEGLLARALAERADAAAYTPLPREEVDLAAARLRRRRTWAVAASGAALAVVAVAVAATLGSPAQTPAPATLTSEERAPYGPLGKYEHSGLPEIPYLVENVFHEPDGSRLELPVARPRSAVRFGEDVYVTEVRGGVGEVLHRVDETGREVASWGTLGEPVLAPDGSALAWLEQRGDHLVLHRGDEHQRVRPTSRLVGIVGNMVVMNAADGVWVSDLNTVPLRLVGLQVATSVAANGLLAAAADDGAVVSDVLGRVKWSSPNWQPGALSPDGRRLVVVGATRARLVSAVLDARTGELIREVEWISPAPGVLDVRWEDRDHLLVLAVDQGESAIMRVDLDGQVSRATPPMAGDEAGSSRYRFASR